MAPLNQLHNVSFNFIFTRVWNVQANVIWNTSALLSAAASCESNQIISFSTIPIAPMFLEIDFEKITIF